MGALTITSVLKANNLGGRHKSVIFTATGPASYDTNGSVLNLSSGNTVLTGLDPLASFEGIHGVRCLGVAAHGSDRHQPVYVRASGGAAATGTVKVRDAAAGAAMSEVASTTDLSSHTFIFEATGY